MLIQLSDSDIERFIEEDIPYGDLTTQLLGIGMQDGRIIFSTREETTICCTEEASRVFEKYGAEIKSYVPSGKRLEMGIEFFAAEGTAEALHAGWKVALNLIEYASGIATHTKRIVDTVKGVNPSIAVLTTRKSFPGTKKIAIKAITAGGALPHRLGLSESVLIFKQHHVFSGGLESVLKNLKNLRLRAPESRIIIEADSAEEALQIAGSNADVVQVDKMDSGELKTLVKNIRKINPVIKISAAGGITESNAANYASSGIDIIVLSSVYFSKPADIGVTLTPVK